MAVSVETSGAVCTVVLHRPAVRNAVDLETAETLEAAFRHFDAEDSLKVAVLWGAGGCFCAGWDLKQGAALAGSSEPLARHAFPPEGGEPPPGPLGPTRLELGKPVIAAMAGAAVAGGLELALWCDLRIMEEDAYVGVFNRRWGIPLMDGGTVRLPRLVGPGRAAELILTGRRVEAGECLRIGLCERVVPHGTARAAAETLAREIAGFPQLGLRADLRSLRGQAGLPLRAAMEREWAGGLEALEREGLEGAGRFAGGAGRHGAFPGTTG